MQLCRSWEVQPTSTDAEVRSAEQHIPTQNMIAGQTHESDAARWQKASRQAAVQRGGLHKCREVIASVRAFWVVRGSWRQVEIYAAWCSPDQ